MTNLHTSIANLKLVKGVKIICFFFNGLRVICISLKPIVRIVPVYGEEEETNLENIISVLFPSFL